MTLCYLNGNQLPLDQARVSVMDRGFLFGDGVYEVIPVYGGRLFRLAEHLERLESSLAQVRLENPLTHARWRAAMEGLIAANGGGDQSLYLQVTRGVAPRRDHAFPEGVAPTLFMMTSPMGEPPRQMQERGIAAITLPDNRWLRCNIKAIALLPNILLRQEAVEQGAAEAILVRDGEATEGAASNLFIVRDGTLITPPKGPRLLPGITRDLIVELAREHALPCEERAVAAQELSAAEEVWLTSSTKEIMPVTTLDARPVGEGAPGPLYRRMLALYQGYKAQLRGGA